MLTRKSGPAVPLVSLEEIKAHLRIGEDETDEDDLIEGLLAAAIGHLDGPRGVLGRCLTDQVWSLTLDRISGPVLLPIPFLASAAAFALADDAALPITLVASGIWSKAHLSGPASGAVRIEMTATAPAEIQPVAAAAIKLLVGHWYLNREAVITGTIATSLPLSVDRLLTPLKVSWF